MTWAEAVALVNAQAARQGVDASGFKLLATRHYGAGETATDVLVDATSSTVRVRAGRSS